MNFVIYFILTAVGMVLYGTVFFEMRILKVIEEMYSFSWPDYVNKSVRERVVGGTTLAILLSIVYTVSLYSIYNNNGIKMAIIGLVGGIYFALTSNPIFGAEKQIKSDKTFQAWTDDVLKEMKND